MIPGEVFPAAGDIELNAGAEVIAVENGQTGPSHSHSCPA